MGYAREEQLHKAFFRGAGLTLANPVYLHSVRAFLEELLSSDVGAGDLTSQALELRAQDASAVVVAKAPGVAAGLSELVWLYGRGGIRVQTLKQDGELLASGDVLLEMKGRRGDLLAYERVGLNLLQRMSGIATMTRHLQDRLQQRSPGTQLVATRKTPWGLLDKRAVHLGGGGTHRLGLWDGIMAKNNHLALLAEREEDAVRIAIERAWQYRRTASFLEIEVRGLQSALSAARTFRDWRERDRGNSDEQQACPCMLLLDNVTVAEAGTIVAALRAEQLLEYVLVEASGNISEDNLEAYAASGVDAISMGALTHSPRVLDLSQRLSEHREDS